MRLSPPHPVVKKALLPTGKKFLPLLIRQVEGFSQLIGGLPHGPFLAVAKDFDQGEHHGLKVGDRHVNPSSIVCWGSVREWIRSPCSTTLVRLPLKKCQPTATSGRCLESGRAIRNRSH